MEQETKETVKAVMSGTPKEKDDKCDHLKKITFKVKCKK